LRRGRAPATSISRWRCRPSVSVSLISCRLSPVVPDYSLTVSALELPVNRQQSGTRWCPRFRLAPSDLVKVNPKNDVTKRYRVIPAQRPRQQLVEQRQTGGKRFSLVLRRIRLQHVGCPAHDSALPIEKSADFINFKGDPTMTLHGIEFDSHRGPAIHPTVGIDVIDGLNVDAIVKSIRDPPDIVSRRERLYLIAFSASCSGCFGNRSSVSRFRSPASCSRFSPAAGNRHRSNESE
jgi:hypothetical protein